MFRSLTSRRTPGNRCACADTRSDVPSVLPSSTTSTSYRIGSDCSARVTFSSVCRMFSDSQYAGMTIDSDRPAEERSTHTPFEGIGGKYTHIVTFLEMVSRTPLRRSKLPGAGSPGGRGGLLGRSHGGNDPERLEGHV